jgi:hypothetical protein
MEILKNVKLIAIATGIALLSFLAGCSNEPSIDSVITANESIEFSLDNSVYPDETDPLAVCDTLSSVGIFFLTSSALMDAKPEDIKRLDSNLEILLLRMDKLNLENSENAKTISAIRSGLNKIKIKSPDSSLYDEVAKEYEIFSNQQLDSYCYDWYVKSTTSDEDSGENVEATPENIEATPQNTQAAGHFETICTTTEVPNPNYDGRVTDDRGVIQWPTITTRQCNQVWVNG